MKNVSPSSAIAQNCAAKPRRRRLKLRRRTPPSPSEKCAAKANPSQNRATKLCRHAPPSLKTAPPKLRRRSPPPRSEKCAATAPPPKLCRQAPPPREKCAAKRLPQPKLRRQTSSPGERAPPIPLPPKDTSPSSAAVRKARRQGPSPANSTTGAQHYTPHPRREILMPEH